jgi:AraC family transcriptional regulator of adaptative response/methylated-DNA-[protein]-cysteine methyltransferase
MTFQAYQRLIRINFALRNIRNGDKVIDAAFNSGYESLSGFTYSFKKATAKTPTESRTDDSLVFTRFATPLGPMMAVASDEGICLLEFTDRRMLETELKQLRKHFKSQILPGTNRHIESLREQVKEYFDGTRREFDVPLVTPGTAFQKEAWNRLLDIPYGTTVSYKHQAIALGNPNAVRAVAQANGCNRISIVIPCHRVIGEDGSLTGYGGGLQRKRWLIDHERKNRQVSEKILR